MGSVGAVIGPTPVSHPKAVITSTRLSVNRGFADPQLVFCACMAHTLTLRFRVTNIVFCRHSMIYTSFILVVCFGALLKSFFRILYTQTTNFYSFYVLI